MASIAPNVKPLFDPPRLMTLQAHMLADERRFPRSNGALSWIVSALSIATKTIAARLRRARLDDVLGEAGGYNVQGEARQKLDVIANEVLIQILRGRDGVAMIGSEEDDDLICLDTRAGDGARFAVMFDPLDGSSNLATAGSVGTIFSVFALADDAARTLSPGNRQIAAGYVLYGTSTIFVITTGDGVHMFVLDPAVGAYIRVAEHLQVPEFGTTYSVNEAYADSFPRGYRRYLKQCRDEGFRARYAGAMVADVHRVLLDGGIFIYPPTKKARDGKLRLMYEANPLALIIVEAGGVATTGTENILDVCPHDLHQRVPVVLGSRDNVADLLCCLNE